MLLIASGLTLVIVGNTPCSSISRKSRSSARRSTSARSSCCRPTSSRASSGCCASETDATGKTILGTMVENIAVAERTNNLLCQDTGIPIYNVTIGRDVEFDGAALKAAIRRGCERATHEHPLRSSVVHPITRKNEQTSCGIGVPVIHVDFDEREETVEIEMIPKGSRLGERLVPADADSGRRRRRDQALRHRLRDRMRRPRLPADHRRRRRRRHLGSVHASCQDRRDAAARHHCADRGRREDRGAAVARRSTSSASARRAWAARSTSFRGACRGRRDAHHDEPGGGEHPVPFGAARQRAIDHAAAASRSS